MNNGKRRLMLRLFALLSCVAAAGAWACSTPVFRYAIERWYPDVYRLEITHTGEMSDVQTAALAWLKEHSVEGEALTNVYARVIDPSKPPQQEPESAAPADAEPPQKAAEDGGKEAETETPPAPSKPGIAVYLPDMYPGKIKVWEGPFTKDAVALVLDSPARQEVANKLIGGAASVWVLLESGDKTKDDAAEKTVRKALKMLQEELELPPDPTVGGADDEEGADAQLTISFDVVRVSRNDPKEAFFVASLLKTEPDLNEFRDPMVFPVFGRGRVLYALVGKGIIEDNIAEACVFLSGACSCQVKAQNPGMDVIMTAHWDRVLEMFEAVEDQELPPLTGVMPYAGPEEPDPEAEKKLAQELAAAESDLAADPVVEKQGSTSPVLLVLAIGAVVVVGGSAMMFRSKSDE